MKVSDRRRPTAEAPRGWCACAALSRAASIAEQAAMGPKAKPSAEATETCARCTRCVPCALPTSIYVMEQLLPTYCIKIELPIIRLWRGRGADRSAILAWLGLYAITTCDMTSRQGHWL